MILPQTRDSLQTLSEYSEADLILLDTCCEGSNLISNVSRSTPLAEQDLDRHIESARFFRDWLLAYETIRITPEVRREVIGKLTWMMHEHRRYIEQQGFRPEQEKNLRIAQLRGLEREIFSHIVKRVLPEDRYRRTFADLVITSYQKWGLRNFDAHDTDEIIVGQAIEEALLRGREVIIFTKDSRIKELIQCVRRAELPRAPYADNTGNVSIAQFYPHEGLFGIAYSLTDHLS